MARHRTSRRRDRCGFHEGLRALTHRAGVGRTAAAHGGQASAPYLGPGAGRREPRGRSDAQLCSSERGTIATASADGRACLGKCCAAAACCLCARARRTRNKRPRTLVSWRLHAASPQRRARALAFKRCRGVPPQTPRVETPLQRRPSCDTAQPIRSTQNAVAALAIAAGRSSLGPRPSRAPLRDQHLPCAVYMWTA